jgi:hypothetical protein
MFEALSSNPNTTKEKKKVGRKERKEVGLGEERRRKENVTEHMEVPVS